MSLHDQEYKNTMISIENYIDKHNMQLIEQTITFKKFRLGYDARVITLVAVKILCESDAKTANTLSY